MLLRLFGHTLALKVWDTKDRVSPRARFDRPKAFRLPMSRGADDESDDVAVQQLVMKQSMSYNQMQPKPSIVKPGKFRTSSFIWKLTLTFLLNRKF